MSEGTDWLKELQEKLWPEEFVKKNRRESRVAIDAYRRLDPPEWTRVLETIKAERLICMMVSTSMFGGYGMKVYDHEEYPGTGAQFLITLHEDHLPGSTVFDAVNGEQPKPDPRHEARQGKGRDDAWEAFSRLTHSEQNQVWLKKYKLQESRDRLYYDY